MQPCPRDPYMWLFHATPACDFCAAQIHLRSWVPLHGFAKSATSSERQRSVVLAHDVLRNFFHSRWASPLINQVCLLNWPFYNSKSFKSNRSARLFRKKKNRELLVRVLVTLSKLPIPLLQWPDLMLAKILIKTSHRSSVSLMSLLNKALGALINSSGCRGLTLIPAWAHCLPRSSL